MTDPINDLQRCLLRLCGRKPRSHQELAGIVNSQMYDLAERGLIGGTGRYKDNYHLTIEGVEELEGEQ